ncbi:MAG: hypothetical protein WAT78_12590 [Rhizobiaceae bacterium]
MMKIAAVAVAIFVARFVSLLPFLDENGRLAIVAPEGHLPANAEYFFSVLLLVLPLAVLAGCWVLFAGVSREQALAHGVKIAVVFLAVFAAIDLMLDFAVAHRGLALWFRNVALDYSPLLVIPIGIGAILKRT